MPAAAGQVEKGTTITMFTFKEAPAQLSENRLRVQYGSGFE